MAPVAIPPLLGWADLVAALSAVHLEGSWTSKLRTHTGLSVLVIDELGDLPMGTTCADVGPVPGLGDGDTQRDREMGLPDPG